MPSDPVFTEQEYAGRLQAVQQAMAERDIDVALISTPENIYYLIGLDHWGYFVPHVLIVPSTGEPTLVTREMERVTVTNQVRNAGFAGHGDVETAADVTVRVLADRGFARYRAHGAANAVIEVVEDLREGKARIGIEKWSGGLPYGLAETIMTGLGHADWVDVSTLVDPIRVIKSPAEQICMREAARVSDAAMLAAIDSIRPGATEREVAAQCHHAMIQAGGTFPGFGPFIRPASRLGEEHTSWGEGCFDDGDAVFLEMAGCVKRYHAPQGRLVFVGEPPASSRAIAVVCTDAFNAATDALQPGVAAGDVYAAWQRVVDDAHLAHYRRHHCGYLVGIGFPPSWTGGNRVSGLRADSDWEIRTGMTFHLLSWLIGTGRGDYFLSNTVLLTESGPEVLTQTPLQLSARRT